VIHELVRNLVLAFLTTKSVEKGSAVSGYTTLLLRHTATLLSYDAVASTGPPSVVACSATTSLTAWPWCAPATTLAGRSLPTLYTHTVSPSSLLQYT